MSEIKLDEKDRKILRALEEDGRAMIKTISKKTGIQRDSTKYRIDKMRKNGVIKAIVPVCDNDKLGYPVYTWMCVQMQHFGKDQERQFEGFLTSHPNVIYLTRVTGHYHYLISILAKTIEELDMITREIISKFPNIIKNYNTSLLIDEIQYDSFYRLLPEA